MGGTVRGLYDGKDDRDEDDHTEHSEGFDGPCGLVPRQIAAICSSRKRLIAVVCSSRKRLIAVVCSSRKRLIAAVCLRRGQNDSTLWMLTNIPWPVRSLVNRVPDSAAAIVHPAAS